MLNVSRNCRNYQDGAVVGYQLTDRSQNGEGVLGMKLNLLMCDIRRTYSALQTIFDLCIPKKTPKYQLIICKYRALSNSHTFANALN
jgi:hypothetical protein